MSSRFCFSLFFLFASLADVFVAAEVQSRARRFCAAKRTLDGFSAATVQSVSEAKRDTLLCSHAAPLSLPYALLVWRVTSPVHFDSFWSAATLTSASKDHWPSYAVARCTACKANLDLHRPYTLRSHRRKRRAVSEWLVDFARNPKLSS